MNRHTDWTVKVMKKNPTRYRRESIAQFLDIPDGPMHPVLAALGGERWLGKGKTTLRRHCLNESDFIVIDSSRK